MTRDGTALQRLLDRLARLHPIDAAAILAELPAGQRALVIERLRAVQPVGQDAGTPRAGVDLSRWLLGLQQADSVLTPHARDALTRHIAASSAEAARRATPFTRGLAALGRWWSGPTGASPQP